MSNRRSPRAAWVGLLGLAGGCASGVATEAAVTPALERAAGRSERAERLGLAAIAAPLVAADVTFLAADELEGRDTPSRGLRIAARYLAHRLECLGFEPGAEAGWFHEWVLVEHSLEAERTWAELAIPGERLALEYGREYAVHPDELEDADVAGELVWGGQASREDFEGLALDGRIALVEEGSESRLRRRRRAADAGAAALVVLAEPLSAESLAQRFGGWRERCRSPSVRMPGEGSADLPVFWLAGEPARRLRELAAGRESGTELGARFSVGADAVREVAVENVCGYWPGGDPALAAEVLVASAHYDHVGIQEGQVYCGADDNASGCAALLAVAEALAAFGPLERSVLLLWVSGEEAGLLGAKAWTQDPWLPLGAAAIANVNLDMVGRNPPALLEYTPTAAHPEHNGLSECLVRLAALEGFTELKSADKDYERSDHAAFAEHLGIPVLYVSTGEHEDYHQPSDTADKVDADKVARVARLVFRLLVEVARDGV